MSLPLSAWKYSPVFQLELAGKSVIKWLVIMVMETPHISCAGHSCAFLSWPLFNPQPCPDAPPWEGGSQARRGLHPAPPYPYSPPPPQRTPSPGGDTCSDINKTAPLQITGHILRPPEAEAMVKTSAHHPPPPTTPPSASFLLLTDACAGIRGPLLQRAGFEPRPHRH